MSSETILLVTGSRDWNDIACIEDVFANLENMNPNTTWLLIHGGCRGADLLAEQVAKQRGWRTLSMPIKSEDWKIYGKKAAFLHNTKMILTTKPHYAVAFQLNDSPGTQHCIQELNKYRGRIDSRMKVPVIIKKAYSTVF